MGCRVGRACPETEQLGLLPPLSHDSWPVRWARNSLEIDVLTKFDGMALLWQRQVGAERRMQVEVSSAGFAP